MNNLNRGGPTSVTRDRHPHREQSGAAGLLDAAGGDKWRRGLWALCRESTGLLTVDGAKETDVKGETKEEVVLSPWMPNRMRQGARQARPDGLHGNERHSTSNGLKRMSCGGAHIVGRIFVCFSAPVSAAARVAHAARAMEDIRYCYSPCPSQHIGFTTGTRRATGSRWDQQSANQRKARVNRPGRACPEEN